MSEDALAPIREEVEIEARVDKVWRTLTETARTPLWLGCMRYEARVGALFYMQQDSAKRAADDISGATHCEILALDAPALFKFSWFVPDMAPTFVSFSLSPLAAGRTRLVFEHEGWEQFPAEAIRPIRDMLAGGWASFVLPGLKRAAETG